MERKKMGKKFIENNILGTIFQHNHLKYRNVCSISAQASKFQDDRKLYLFFGNNREWNFVLLYRNENDIH